MALLSDNNIGILNYTSVFVVEILFKWHHLIDKLRIQ